MSNENQQSKAELLAEQLDAVPETGADPELIEQAAAELRRLNLYAEGANQLVEVWKERAQEFMKSRDAQLDALKLAHVYLNGGPGFTLENHKAAYDAVCAAITKITGVPT